MLKGIPSILSPDLLQVLMAMGHGDEICLGDGNFPHTSMNHRVIRCDGHDIPSLLDAILKFFPLDTHDRHPVMLMEVMPGDPVQTPIWDVYRDLIAQYDVRAAQNILPIERFAFYERAKTAFAVVATGEKALYANIILKKGVVVE